MSYPHYEKPSLYDYSVKTTTSDRSDVPMKCEERERLNARIDEMGFQESNPILRQMATRDLRDHIATCPTCKGEKE